MKYKTHYGNSLIKGKQREKVIEKCKGFCAECKMTRSEHFLKFGRDITINHKDGNGRGKKDPNNNIHNLGVLCLTCHGKKDIKRRRPYNEIPKESREKMMSNLIPFRNKKFYFSNE